MNIQQCVIYDIIGLGFANKDSLVLMVIFRMQQPLKKKNCGIQDFFFYLSYSALLLCVKTPV